jgi:hypothetical protein
MGGYPLRALMGIAAMAILCLVGAYGTYDSLVTQSRESPDGFKIAAQHQRFAAMAAMVPPDTILGYISDQPHDSPDGSASFYGVQYALGPRLVVVESDRNQREWVVGSYWKKPDVAEIEKTRHLRLVRNFGMGAYLFRRAN